MFQLPTNSLGLLVLKCNGPPCARHLHSQHCSSMTVFMFPLQIDSRAYAYWWSHGHTSCIMCMHGKSQQHVIAPYHVWGQLGRVHTTLFRTGRDRSRPVHAQLPVSTRGQLERSFRILETTSRHGTSGRDRSRSVAPCQIYRVDARVGATDLSANQPLLAHAFLIYFFPF